MEQKQLISSFFSFVPNPLFIPSQSILCSSLPPTKPCMLFTQGCMLCPILFSQDMFHLVELTIIKMSTIYILLMQKSLSIFQSSPMYSISYRSSLFDFSIATCQTPHLSLFIPTSSYISFLSECHYHLSKLET